MSNLITHHPKSTLEDIVETRRVLKLVPHFLPFCISKFCLYYGSPIYLEFEARAGGVAPIVKYPIGDAEFMITGEYCPVKSGERSLHASWDRFTVWYVKFKKAKKGTLRVTRYPDDSLEIVDLRNLGKRLVTRLSGDEARLYNLAHQGPSLKILEKELGILRGTIESSINRLCRRLTEMMGGRI